MLNIEDYKLITTHLDKVDLENISKEPLNLSNILLEYFSNDDSLDKEYITFRNAVSFKISIGEFLLKNHLDLLNSKETISEGLNPIDVFETYVTNDFDFEFTDDFFKEWNSELIQIVKRELNLPSKVIYTDVDFDSEEYISELQEDYSHLIVNRLGVKTEMFPIKYILKKEVEYEAS